MWTKWFPSDHYSTFWNVKLCTATGLKEWLNEKKEIPEKRSQGNYWGVHKFNFRHNKRVRWCEVDSSNEQKTFLNRFSLETSPASSSPALSQTRLLYFNLPTTFLSHHIFLLILTLILGLLLSCFLQWYQGRLVLPSPHPMSMSSSHERTMERWNQKKPAARQFQTLRTWRYVGISY